AERLLGAHERGESVPVTRLLGLQAREVVTDRADVLAEPRELALDPVGLVAARGPRHGGRAGASDAERDEDGRHPGPAAERAHEALSGRGRRRLSAGLHARWRGLRAGPLAHGSGPFVEGCAGPLLRLSLPPLELGLQAEPLGSLVFELDAEPPLALLRLLEGAHDLRGVTALGPWVRRRDAGQRPMLGRRRALARPGAAGGRGARRVATVLG